MLLAVEAEKQTLGGGVAMHRSAVASRGLALGKERREHVVTITVEPSSKSSTHETNCSTPSPTTLVDCPPVQVCSGCYIYSFNADAR